MVKVRTWHNQKEKKKKGHILILWIWFWNCVLYIYRNITLLFINLFIIIILQKFWLVEQISNMWSKYEQIITNAENYNRSGPGRNREDSSLLHILDLQTRLFSTNPRTKPSQVDKISLRSSFGHVINWMSISGLQFWILIFFFFSLL